MKKILIAVGDEKYTRILRDELSPVEGFKLCKNDVHHMRYLLELIEDEAPDIVIVHDEYLESSIKDEVERETEWLQTFKALRSRYEDGLRIVFLCERQRGDHFLSELVKVNVLDIFNENAIEMQSFTEQLLDRPRFARVNKFVLSDRELEDLQLADKPPEEEPMEQPVSTKQSVDQTVVTPAKPTKQPIVKQKVVEKKIVQKQVVKREIKFEVKPQTTAFVGVPVGSKLILVGGNGKRTGATFFSHQLAFKLADYQLSVSYIENPFAYAYTYDRYYGQDEAPDYVSPFYTEVEGALPMWAQSQSWKLNNVNMVIQNPLREEVYGEELTTDKLLRIIMAQRTTFTIVDIGDAWDHPVIQPLFGMADQIVLMIDSDVIQTQILMEKQPYKMLFDHTGLKEHIRVVMNKASREMASHELFESTYDYVETIPMLDRDEVFKSEMKRRPLSENKVLDPLIDEALQPFIEELVPKELQKTAKKKASFLKFPKLSIKTNRQ
ncbi:hypothetical protein [Priestia koreensis]|uniref:hypothetical protein n=1 Tax=Priestia koreensis TaxID=284581 RepID=UPI001F594640|nr:hypothetical protein [Priestia koreensis]UNL87461.1 hypothetical protein IE339_24400 [Priestia koreensis]